MNTFSRSTSDAFHARRAVSVGLTYFSPIVLTSRGRVPGRVREREVEVNLPTGGQGEEKEEEEELDQARHVGTVLGEKYGRSEILTLRL